jgi:hypothetical protein
MSVSDVDEMEAQLDEVADCFADMMKRVFDEEPEIFTGRSTKWDWNAACSAASDDLRKELDQVIEKFEVKLHNGEYQ